MMKIKPPLSRHHFLLLSGGVLGTGLVGCSGGGGIATPSGSSGRTKAVPEPSPSPTAPPVPASIAIQRSQTMGALAPMAVGLSYEKSVVSKPRCFNPGNAGLIGCFTRLGASVLRVGGNSVDQTTWTPGGAGNTNGEVAPSDISAFAGFVRAAGWRVIYGINLATNTPAAAAAEAAYAYGVLGSSLAGFEIGNECDDYSTNGIRPSTYTLADFVAEWSTYVAAIRQIVPNAPISGPASAGHVPSWTTPFAASEGSTIDLLTQHYYRDSGYAATATMSELLSSSPVLQAYITQLQAAVAADNISGGYRFTEANSFYYGGAPGVSNAYGSALWAVDFLLTSAQYGCAGANFHGGGEAYYTPISDKEGSVDEIRPVYYGMLLVAQIPPGPMYAVDVTTELVLTAYAIAGDDGATYLVVVNKDAASAAATTVALGAPAAGANALILAGTGLLATSGTTLGGSIVAPNGSWSPGIEPGIQASGSTLTFSVAPASAVLLKIV